MRWQYMAQKPNSSIQKEKRLFAASSQDGSRDSFFHDHWLQKMAAHGDVNQPVWCLLSTKEIPQRLFRLRVGR